jgi:hypothetical protein
MATGGLFALSFGLLLTGSLPPLVGLAGLFGLALGATGTAVLVAQLPRSWPVLGIDSRGLHFRYVGLVPWEEIESLRIRRPLRQKVLSATPMDKSILARQPGRRGMMDWISVGAGRNELNIWDQQLSISLDDLLALMRRYYPVDGLLWRA